MDSFSTSNQQDVEKANEYLFRISNGDNLSIIKFYKFLSFNILKDNNILIHYKKTIEYNFAEMINNIYTVLFYLTCFYLFGSFIHRKITFNNSDNLMMLIIQNVLFLVFVVLYIFISKKLKVEFFIKILRKFPFLSIFTILRFKKESGLGNSNTPE